MTPHRGPLARKPLAFLTILATLALIFMTPARADECTLLPIGVPVAELPGEVGKLGTVLETLCRAVNGPTAGPRWESGDLGALRAMASVVAAKGQVTDLDNVDLREKALAEVMPPESRERCKNAVAACLRPKCLDESHRTDLECRNFPSLTSDQKDQFTGTTCKEKPCYKIDEASVDLAVAEALLRPVVQLLAKHADVKTACGISPSGKASAQQCFEILFSDLSSISASLFEQEYLATILNKLMERKTELPKLDELVAFHKYWHDNVAPLLEPPQANTSATKSSPLYIMMTSDMEATSGEREETYRLARIAVVNKVAAGRREVAKFINSRFVYLSGKIKGRTEELRPFQASLSKLLADDPGKTVTDILADWQTNKPTVPDDAFSVQDIAAVYHYAGKLPILETADAWIRRQAATLTAPQCEASNSQKLDGATGLFDFCVDRDTGTKSSVADGFSAVRFAFAPCAVATDHCKTTGHLDLVTHLASPQRDGLTTLVESLVPMGVNQITGVIEDGRLKLATHLAGVAFLDKEQLSAAVAQFLPAPFALAYDTIEIGDGPTIELTVHPALIVPGVGQLPSLKIKLGPDVATVRIADLRKQISRKIVEATRDRRISVNGLAMTIDQDGIALVDPSPCNGGSSGEAANGKATFTLDTVQSINMDAELAVQCDGRIGFKLTDRNRLEGALKSLAGSMRLADLENITLDGTTVRFSATLSGECRRSFWFAVDGPDGIKPLLGQAAAAAASCLGDSALKALQETLGLTLPFQWDPTKPTVVCTPSGTPIGQICLVGKTALTEKNYWDGLTVQDDGVLRGQVAGYLSPFAPTVRSFSLDKNHQLNLRVGITLPGI